MTVAIAVCLIRVTFGRCMGLSTVSIAFGLVDFRSRRVDVQIIRLLLERGAL